MPKYSTIFNVHLSTSITINEVLVITSRFEVTDIYDQDPFPQLAVQQVSEYLLNTKHYWSHELLLQSICLKELFLRQERGSTRTIPLIIL